MPKKSGVAALRRPVRVAYLRPDGREATARKKPCGLTSPHRQAPCKRQGEQERLFRTRGRFAKERSPQTARDIAAASRPVSAAVTGEPRRFTPASKSLPRCSRQRHRTTRQDHRRSSLASDGAALFEERAKAGSKGREKGGMRLKPRRKAAGAFS